MTHWQLDRLLLTGGKNVTVGKLTPAQLREIRKVVPPRYADKFDAAKPAIFADERLVKSLRKERSRHSARLIKALPEIIKKGCIYGNDNESFTGRPLIALPTTDMRKPNRYDVMSLDTDKVPGEIGIPTVMTTPRTRVERFPRQR